MDATQLLQLASTRFGVRFVPGPVCNGAPHCIRLAFSFYPPEEIREGVRRLAAALDSYMQEHAGTGSAESEAVAGGAV